HPQSYRPVLPTSSGASPAPAPRSPSERTFAPPGTPESLLPCPPLPALAHLSPALNSGPSPAPWKEEEAGRLKATGRGRAVERERAGGEEACARFFLAVYPENTVPQTGCDIEKRCSFGLTLLKLQ
ncbi:hypothetical protein H1C71_036091, partial [Ictidomys tridecemlineatus]